MKEKVIGYICFGEKLDQEDKLFFKLAKKKKIKLIPFNAFYEIEEEELEKLVKKCDVIFNNSSDIGALELSKTIEALGGKVVDSSKTYYYPEDKWDFFVKCKEHNIPTPNTVLLPEDLKEAIIEIKKFSEWPVVLKRISGTCGKYVERARNSEEAIKIIRNFWEKGGERLPIIAQEYISSPSYRVTIIGNKIVQTAVKKNFNWKATGVYSKKFYKFKVNKELGKIIKKILKISNIKICGIDFVKKGDNWLVLEINAQPAFDFFENEREKLILKVFDFLIKETTSK